MHKKIFVFLLPLLFIPLLKDLKAEERPTKPLAKDIISWQDADKYYGQHKTVDGIIVKTNNTGKTVFLNFHPNWKRYFTAVIFDRDFHLFPNNPEKYYLNKHVRVTGIIKEYKGKPEIILTSPDQIRILNK
ncbi:MAG: hypothetical protein AABY44_05590 [Nitrospirota bacterium]